MTKFCFTLALDIYVPCQNILTPIFLPTELVLVCCFSYLIHRNENQFAGSKVRGNSPRHLASLKWVRTHSPSYNDCNRFSPICNVNWLTEHNNFSPILWHRIKITRGWCLHLQLDELLCKCHQWCLISTLYIHGLIVVRKRRYVWQISLQKRSSMSLVLWWLIVNMKSFIIDISCLFVFDISP